MSDVNIEKLKSVNFEIEYDDIVDEYADLCCSKIQNKSPKGFRGQYAQGWRVEDKKYKSEYYAVVHNATDYQLTHLLENGHIIANKRDGTGWASAKPHINPAYRSVKNKFIRAIKNAKINIDTKK